MPTNTSPLQIPQLQGAPSNKPLNDDPLDPNAPPAVNGAVPAGPTTTTPPTAYTPDQIALDPATDTVEGRVSNIVKKGGELQQLAETGANQRAQQKGLLNTSIAAGAAHKANLESALPIAQEDARTSFAAKQANITAINRAKEQEAAFGQQTALQREKEQIDKRLLTASADEQIRLIARKGEVDTALQTLAGEQALVQIGARGEVETGLINRRGEIEKELQAADAETRKELIKEQGKIDYDLVVARSEEEMKIRERQSELDQELATLSARYKSQDLASQQLHETKLNNERMDLEERMTELKAEQQLVLQKLQGEQAVQLEDVRGFYDGQISTQKSAAVLYQSAQNAIAQMMMNPDMTATERNNAVQYQIDNLEASLGVLGAMGGVNISAILGNTTFNPALTSPPMPTQSPNWTKSSNAAGGTTYSPSSTVSSGIPTRTHIDPGEYNVIAPSVRPTSPPATMSPPKPTPTPTPTPTSTPKPVFDPRKWITPKRSTPKPAPKKPAPKKPAPKKPAPKKPVRRTGGGGGGSSKNYGSAWQHR